MWTIRQELELLAAGLFLITSATALAQPAPPALPPAPPGLTQPASDPRSTAPNKPQMPAPGSAVKPKTVTNSLIHPPVNVFTALEKPAPLMADANLKEVLAKLGETNANFTFYLTNVSSAPILINSVRTSCGCTVAKLASTPWKLESGSNGPVEVMVDLRGKRGTITKQVTVVSDSGTKMLQVQVVIPLMPLSETNTVERARNMEIAKANRQAIFHGDCASCHLTPAVGKSGKELYDAACGICHDSDNRATSVPDLHTLAIQTDAAYWRKWVTSGKVGGMMPSFAKEEGGPLNEEQIWSLVHYLSRNFNPVAVPRPTQVLPRPAVPR